MKLSSEQLAQFVREKDGVTPRTSFAAHTYNQMFAKPGRHPRLLEPIEPLPDDCLLRDDIRVELKQAA